MSPLLESVHNFRDIAGPGYRVDGGGVMAPGRVFRSSALEVADHEVDAWERMGVSRVVDLRTEKEIVRQPDILPAGADYVTIDVLAGVRAGAVLENSVGMSADRARAEMLRTYESFARGQGVRRAFGSAVRAVAGGGGPVVVHCTAGKDRTGWIVAVLQLLAGMSDEDVETDYLLSNELSEQYYDSIRAKIAAQMPEYLGAVEAFLVVQPDYLAGALAALRDEFGGVGEYLVAGAGVDESVVEALRQRLRS